MNFFPIFARELRSERESHRLRKQRLVAGLIAGAILVVLIFAERWVGGISLRRLISVIPIAIAGVGPFMLLVIGLSRAGNLLSVERREGTLPLLLLTRMTGHDIVLGKLLQALLVAKDDGIGAWNIGIGIFSRLPIGLVYRHQSGPRPSLSLSFRGRAAESGRRQGRGPSESAHR
jgi:hypothetical protein